MSVKAVCDCDESKVYTGIDRVAKAHEWAREHERYHKERTSDLINWFASAPPMSDKVRSQIRDIIQAMK